MEVVDECPQGLQQHPSCAKPFVGQSSQFRLATVAIFAFAALGCIWWWSVFAGCHRSLASWLAIECACIVGICGLFFAGYSNAGCGWIWFVQPPTLISARMFQTTWAAILPCGFLWLERGIAWLGEAMEDPSECLSERACVVICCVLVVGGLATIGYAVFAGNVIWYGRSLQKSAALMRTVEDADLVARWGHQSPKLSSEFNGLSAACLASMHMAKWEDAPTTATCAICLEKVVAGDLVRQLQCEHVFHRPCVDLWLLRHPNCPLCKQAVGP